MNENTAFLAQVNTRILELYDARSATTTYHDIARAINREFGTDYSSDAIRKRVRRRRAKEPVVGVVMGGDAQLYRTAGELREAQPAKPELTHEERVAALHEQMLEAQLANARSQQVKADARTAELYAILRTGLAKIADATRSITKVTTQPVRVLDPSHEETAVLVLSDIHLGKKTDRYSTEEALRSFEHVVDKFIDIVRLHRNAYPIRKAVIMWTGDIVDGEGIYPTHAHHVDHHVVDQIFLSIPRIMARLKVLDAEFDSVEHRFVDGNHGRVSKTAHERANFDRIFAMAVSVAGENLTRSKFFIADKWYSVFNVYDTRILQYHGHQIKMHLNLPWYGITTRLSRWATTKEVEDFDIAVQGHFHTSSILSWNSKTIITNGTMVDNDQFALEFIGLESSRSQRAFGVSPDRGLTWTYEITL